jgi:hypothetical protein
LHYLGSHGVGITVFYNDTCCFNTRLRKLTNQPVSATLITVDFEPPHDPAAVVYMAAVTLSYSQALRVIGQNLIPLGTDWFELVKWGDDYIVWMRQTELPRALAAKKTLFNKFIEKILGNVDSDKKTPDRIYFNDMDILTSDLEHQAKRRTGSPTDVRDLSFVLRVLGNYLDRKAAREFNISVDPDSIKVRYDQKEERFTSQDLYDLGIQMYLRRSGRA